MECRRLALALAVLAVSVAAVPAGVAQGPTDCSTAAFDTVRSCRGLPGGGSGSYYDTPVCFVYGGTNPDGGVSAGAGSLAGGNVRTGPGVVALVVYGSTVVAFHRVGVTTEAVWGGSTVGAPGVLVTVPVQQWGMAGEHASKSSVFVGDRDRDNNPDVRVVVAGSEVKLLP